MRMTGCHQLTLLVGLVGLPSLLSGCSPGPFDGPFADLARQDLGAISSGDRVLLDRAQGPGGHRPTSEVEVIVESAGVEDYVQLALASNPSIRSAQERIERMREKIPQVTSLDDPMVMIAPFGNMAETAAGQVGVMTSVSQKFPYHGKLETRGRIAQQDVAIAIQNLERVRQSVIADTRRAYWSLYYSVRAIEVTTQSRDLLAQLREVVHAKYRTGTVTQQAVLRVSVELNNLDNELITLEQRRRSASGMLNSLVNRPVQAELPDPQPMHELSKVDVDLDALLASAAQANPEIRAMREQITQFREQREMARLNRYPDLTISANYNAVDDEGLSMISNGKDQWWFGFGANIPIWNERLSAAQREATRGILETSAALADKQNRISFRVQDAFISVDTQQRRAILLRDVIVPEARQTVEASLSGFRAGSVDFLTLIDNWRKLLDFELMYQSSLTELERSFAQLEEAVGRDVDRHAGAVKEAQP